MPFGVMSYLRVGPVTYMRLRRQCPIVSATSIAAAQNEPVTRVLCQCQVDGGHRKITSVDNIRSHSR